MHIFYSFTARHLPDEIKAIDLQQEHELIFITEFYQKTMQDHPKTKNRDLLMVPDVKHPQAT